MEDDELPPGEDSVPAESSPVYQESLEPAAQLHTAAEAVQEAQEPTQEAAAPPPPPIAPKKEPTVIHVPLKIPEGARKKQVMIQERAMLMRPQGHFIDPPVAPPSKHLLMDSQSTESFKSICPALL